VVVGGVASNLALRKRLLSLLQDIHKNDTENIDQPPDVIESILPWQLIFPPVKLCTDNGVMVAWTGIEKLQEGISNDIQGQDVIARWPLGHPITTIV